ncbi:MAG: DUF433 domain-containing protein [Candidatus Bathyarchaeia archaeon]
MGAEGRLLKRVVFDPKVMLGKPVIRGTRVPVELILKPLAQTLSPKDERYGDPEGLPQLTRKDIKAALLYGSRIVGREEVHPLLVE